jgi:phosphoribosylanthranilate isomerase
VAAVTRIKICGITTGEDIRLCVEAGVQALGFVVEYPIDVPWNLDRRTAGALMKRVPPFVSRVIVVGDDPGTIIELTELLKPHVVQLHGDEPVSVTATLVSAIHDLGAQVIKPLRFSVETGKCLSACVDPLDAARLIEETGVDALLLDSVSKARPAGTGRRVDWAVARRIREHTRLPVILAGGLHAGNVAEAVAAVNPYGVDVISGVENPVGRKDPGEVRAFVEAVSGHGGR